ncbi:XRE family transcriptional regulator [Streptomyces hydrogenans]|uniref:XRE family transcriptional regulator n=1 Tax=Streptomyces hydrogenans TaxID=1873719 RepID=UPI003812BC93
MTTPAPLYRLVSTELLKTLMRRTGTGAPVSVRTLARKAGLPHGTVGNLLTGVQTAVSEESAHKIAGVIGVDLLVLFVPMQRADANRSSPHTLSAVTA